MNTETEQPLAVVTRSSSAVGEALGVEDIIAQVRLIQNVMHKVMREGEHFGKIPGCGDKATLLQPGAQKLTMTFRLAPEYQLQETDLARGHKEYRVICSLKSIQSGTFVGQGVGCCSTMESKYRYRGGSRKCPICGKETIIKGKAEYGGGWLCFQKKGGCGMKWLDGAAVIENQSVDKVEHDNPADHYNTVLKMAKKRAFVDATITATAASDIFTQDIGDDEGNGNAQDAPEVKQAAQTPSAQQNPVATHLRPKEAPPKQATEATKEWMLKALEEMFGSEAVHEYATKNGVLLDTESNADWPMSKVTTSREALGQLQKAMHVFFDGGVPAETPASAGTRNADDDADDLPFDEGDAPLPKEIGDVIVPVPRKGQTRSDYLRAPDTIGSLFAARHGTDDEAQEARQRLWGFVHNYEAKPWTGKDGKQRPPSASDVKFRESLDLFSDWFEKTHPDEKL